MSHQSIQINEDTAQDFRNAAALDKAAREGDSRTTGIKTTIGGITNSITFNEHGAQTTSSSSTRVSSADLQSHQGEILATAVTPNGLPVHNRDVGDTDLVRVGNVQISARLAYESGLIGKDSQGRYSDLGK